MTVASIAIEIDHHIAPEFLAKIKSDIANEFYRQRIVSVHMKNRCLDHFGDVGAIHRRTRVFGKRGETNLIVYHHVHGAAGSVARQL